MFDRYDQPNSFETVRRSCRPCSCVFFCGEMLSRPACKVGPRASSSTGVYGRIWLGICYSNPIERGPKPGNWMYCTLLDFLLIFGESPSHSMVHLQRISLFGPGMYRMTSGQFCPILIGIWHDFESEIRFLNLLTGEMKQSSSDLVCRSLQGAELPAPEAGISAMYKSQTIQTLITL